MFEVIKNNLSRLEQIEIFVFERKTKCGLPLQERLRLILLRDGAEYFGIGGHRMDALLVRLSTVIRYVEMDFDSDAGRIDQHSLNQLQSGPLDWFFHVAGLTDLGSTPAAVSALRNVNVEGTRRVLELIANLRVTEFCYVSTAYACGIASGSVQPDYVDSARRFRNPYEQSKVEAETLVRKVAAKTGTRCRYFRPATICGRLQDPPWGAVCKFDVFYSWPAFFFRLRLNDGPPLPDDRSCELNVRICYSRKSGLNIVPVDYVVKVMYLICEQNDPGESYHLVSNAETPHDFYIPKMLESIRVSGVTHVDRVPHDKNSLETLYYRSVGSLYTPYINGEPIYFDTTNLDGLLRRFNLRCPKLDEQTLAMLMTYAKDRDFGLKTRQ